MPPDEDRTWSFYADGGFESHMSEMIISVKARARAKTRELTVGADGVYRIKTTAPPEKNKANEDIVDMLADHLRIPKNQIKLISGQTSTSKRFKVTK